MNDFAHSTPRQPRLHRGFTLVELMTSVVVAAVLLAVAVPGLAGFVRSSRVNAAQSELVSSMMLARSEASKRGQDVTLVALPGSSATPVTATDYSNGWLVGFDQNGDGVIDTSANSAEVIRRYPAPAAGMVIKAGSFAPAVRFASTGFLTPATAVVFSVCDASNPNAPVKGYIVSLQPVGLADISPATVCSP